MTLIESHPRSPAKVAMTEAQYLTLEDPRVEWSEGHALFMSPVSIPHARITGWLFRIASQLAEKTSAGEVFSDGVAQRLSSGNYTVPDLLFIAQHRLNVIKPTHIEGPADLIVEVVSPDSRNRDYHQKFAEYESAGVREYWIIDPVYQTIDLYRLADGEYTKIDPVNGLLASAVLQGLALNPDWLKQSPLPLPDTLREK